MSKLARFPVGMVSLAQKAVVGPLKPAEEKGNSGYPD
jgi:hypothetical protein